MLFRGHRGGNIGPLIETLGKTIATRRHLASLLKASNHRHKYDMTPLMQARAFDGVGLPGNAYFKRLFG